MPHDRAGDIAPYPSPTSRDAPPDHYFAPLGSTTEQSHQQQLQQQQALSQAQREEYMRQAAQSQQSPQHRRQQELAEEQLANQGQSYLQGSAQNQPLKLQTQPLELHDNVPAQDSSAVASDQPYHQQQALQYLEEASVQHQPRQLSQSSTDSEASGHLRDFSLLAEAAKRAQVAVVTRDLEDISL